MRKGSARVAEQSPKAIVAAIQNEALLIAGDVVSFADRRAPTFVAL